MDVLVRMSYEYWNSEVEPSTSLIRVIGREFGAMSFVISEAIWVTCSYSS